MIKKDMIEKDGSIRSLFYYYYYQLIYYANFSIVIEFDLEVRFGNDFKLFFGNTCTQQTRLRPTKRLVKTIALKKHNKHMGQTLFDTIYHDHNNNNNNKQTLWQSLWKI